MKLTSARCFVENLHHSAGRGRRCQLGALQLCLLSLKSCDPTLLLSQADHMAFNGCSTVHNPVITMTNVHHEGNDLNMSCCSGSAAFSRQRPEVSVGRPAAVSPEPEVMSPPSSPRLRHSTFGATLDFIEALCDASSGLTAFATVSFMLCLCRLSARLSLPIFVLP